MPRISGKTGQISLAGGGAVADIFDWTIEFNMALEPCGIKGAVAENYAAGEFTGTLRAQRFATNSTSDVALADDVIALAATAAGDTAGLQLAYVLRTMGTAGQGITVSGSGYVGSGRLNSPRQMGTDEFELTLNSVPVIGAG